MAAQTSPDLTGDSADPRGKGKSEWEATGPTQIQPRQADRDALSITVPLSVPASSGSFIISEQHEVVVSQTELDSLYCALQWLPAPQVVKMRICVTPSVKVRAVQPAISPAHMVSFKGLGR